MAKFYYNRILQGKMAIDEVPKRYREQVRQMLEEDGYTFDEDGYVINSVGNKTEVM